MYERELRAYVEQRLRHPLDDRYWNYFKFAGLVGDATATVHSDELDALVEHARQLSRGGPPPVPRGSVQLPPVTAGGSSVTARARALSQLVADEAAADPLVVDYRDRYLGGRTIAFADVEALVGSPAARLVPADVLWSHGVALLGHTSRIIRKERLDCVWCGREDRGWVEYEIEEGGIRRSITVIDVPSRHRLLVYESDGQPELGAAVGNESPLDELLSRADALAGAYRWRSSEAAAFILEGSVPFVRPVEVTTMFHVAPTGRRQATITLAVDPAVSATEVARAYSAAQLLALRKPPRATDARTMAAITYVTKERRSQPGVSWRDLMSGFNAFWADHADGEAPEPFTNPSSFQQAVGRGKTNLGGLVKVSRQIELSLSIDGDPFGSALPEVVGQQPGRERQGRDGQQQQEVEPQDPGRPGS